MLWFVLKSSKSSSSSSTDSWKHWRVFFFGVRCLFFFFSEMKLYFCTRASLFVTICGVKPFRAYWDPNLLKLKINTKKNIRGGTEGHWLVTGWAIQQTRTSAFYPLVCTEPFRSRLRSLWSQRRHQQSQNQLDDGSLSSEDTLLQNNGEDCLSI